MSRAARQDRCPHCGEASRLEVDNRWRPFCSERCKLIDLGEWFGERYGVAAEEEPLSETLKAEPPRRPQ